MGSRLTHGRGILGVVLPLAARLPLVTGRLFRMIGIIRWAIVPGGMLAFPPRRSLKSCMAYCRSSHVVDGTPQRVVDHLDVEVKQT